MVEYVQCTMKKPVGKASYMVDTAWIPVKFAKVGKFLDIKYESGWSKGWEVLEVYSDWIVTADEAVARETDYKRQRRASDI